MNATVVIMIVIPSNNASNYLALCLVIGLAENLKRRDPTFGLYEIFVRLLV